MRCLLCCDIDGTLIGDTVALQRFNKYVSEHKGSRILVYNSERPLPIMLDYVRSRRLLLPDYYISQHGAQIFSFSRPLDPESAELDSSYEELRRGTGFNLTKIREV